MVPAARVMFIYGLDSSRALVRHPDFSSLVPHNTDLLAAYRDEGNCLEMTQLRRTDRPVDFGGGIQTYYHLLKRIWHLMLIL
jgi:hypothetical protein